MDGSGQIAAQKLGITFRDMSLLEQALTHRSYAYESGIALDNEKLEFLGDAVLGLIIAEQVYRIYPDDDEGLLSRLKSVAVSERTLSEVAATIGIGELLRFGRGEQCSGGAARISNLANAFEAILGALYLDQGIEAVRPFVLEHLGQVISDGLVAEKPFSPRTELQEYVQKKWHVFPEYRLVSQSHPDKHNECLFMIEVYVNGKKWGSGRGHSKKEACRNAAAEAMLEIKTGP